MFVLLFDVEDNCTDDSVVDGDSDDLGDDGDDIEVFDNIALEEEKGIIVADFSKDLFGVSCCNCGEVAEVEVFEVGEDDIVSFSFAIFC